MLAIGVALSFTIFDQHRSSLTDSIDDARVFDAIEPDGASDRSDGVTLIDLGIDPVVVEGAPTAPVDEGPVPTTTWWLVAGVVLAAAALGALAWWTFSDGEASTDEGEAGVGSPDRGEGSSDDEP